MARSSLIVVDDFYEDPDAIRALALAQTYVRKPMAIYPGREAVVPGRDWSQERMRLRAYIDEPCDAPCPKREPFPQGKFRLALAEDEATRVDRAHFDQQRWSAVVYLSRNEDCREGLVLYRHRPTGSVVLDESWLRANFGHLYHLPPDESRREILAFFRDPEQFEAIGLIPMAYNRAIIMMAQVFHGSGVAFGDCPEHGRLSQHFEFYA